MTALIRTRWLLLLTISALVPANPVSPGNFTYQNPLPVKIADPAVLRTGRGEFLYYLAGTSAVRYGSNDLVNWRRLENWVSFEDSWAESNIWAAEALEHNGRFYYHFSAKGETSEGRRKICIAVADSPDARFEPLAYPLWEDEYEWIDSHVFIEEDGTPWLFVTNDSNDVFDGNARLYVAEMESDLSAVKGDFTFLVEPSQEWESQWQEGASVLFHEGTYYMTWSSNLFATDSYAVGYATAPHPRGPWTKAPENPILSLRATEPALIGYGGPGHNSFTLSPDGSELFIVYHTRRNSPHGGARQLNIDRAVFVPSASGPARLAVPGAPTMTAQSYPCGAAPWPAGTGDEFDGDTLDLDRWPAVYGPDLRWVSVRDGALQIISLPGSVHKTATGGSNILLQYPPAGDRWSITARVHFDPKHNHEKAFLTVWRDSNNYLMLKHIHVNGPKFEASVEIGEEYESDIVPNAIGETVWLRIRREGMRYYQEVSAGGESWEQVGRDFVFPHDHVMVGLGGLRSGSPRTLVVPRFDFFRVSDGGE